MAIYPTGVSDDVVALCTSKETIASALAKANANASIHSICETLYPKPFVLKRLVNRFTIKHDLYHGRGDPTKEDLDRAEQCGKFPYRPSDLFLKMFSDVLLCLERDPLAGVCSPPLIGTSGVMPLTVLSVIPDIMQHYYDCIVLAEHEVILATNYWQPSNSVDKISNGLRELSKRAGTRGQKALPVKIMWDRGQLSQAVDNHAMVDQEGREELKLPTLAEIPNLTLEVINFHRPIMGTFHAKFLIIDRKVALINSNNIQDRPNLEMMCHLEGPVVEAFYDIFLFSWHHKLTPVLPCLMQPKPASNVEGLTADDFKFLETNPYLRGIDIVKAAKAARAMLNLQKIDDDKLAKIKREGDEKEQRESVGGLNTQARFRGVLGALSEGRRGSFGSESEDRPASAQHALNGTSSGSAVVPGIDGTGTAAALKQPSLRFTDVVMQAYDKRRKSFQGAARPAMPTILSTNGPPSQSDSASVSREVSPAASRSVTRADEESASAPRPVSTSLEPSFVNWSQPLQTSQANDLATNGIDGLPASSTETIPHALPALDLPNPSFESQPETPVRAVAQSSAADANALASIDTALLQAGATPSHPPTNGQRPLSPVYSEGRNSASHPSPLPEGDGQQSGTSAAPAVAADASAPIAMFPKSSSIPQDLQTPPSSAFHQQDGASPQPNGSSATPASVASPTLGSSPSSRKLSDLGGGQQGGTAPGSSLSNGQTTPSSVSANRKSFMGGINVGRSRSKSGSIRSGKGGSSILSPAGPPGSHTPRQRALSSVLNAGALSEAWSTVEDTDVLDEFNPHVLHKKHNPFPIALVNRKPHGLPGHQDIRVPQDAAWLAGFRYARKSVFIQTPTFNAKPIVNAAIEACRRGIQVTIYVDLGFNDKGESMPFQGGTNEEVVERMYRDLKKGGHGHEKQLHVYWYTGKDQVRPLNAVKKQRNCHVKFMQIDDEVGIQGNGNQDTQSWYHSCEVNIMVDSKQIVAEWMEALHRQQNTQLYGRVDDDGVWRDRATGKTVAQLEEWENAQKERAERERMESESGSLPKRTGSRISLLRRDSARSANASQSSLRASVPPASSTAKIAA